MTFTLDDQTAERMDRTARRLGLPKSGVVREAILNTGDFNDIAGLDLYHPEQGPA